jgi:hypothetical protein
LILKVREVDDAVIDEKISAAVLVDARSDVEVARRHVEKPSFRPPNEHAAAFFRRAHLGKEDVFAVERELPQTDRALHDEVGRDR